MKNKKLFVSLLMLLGSINVLSSCNSHTHHLKHIDKLDPTCVDDGHKDYYECEDEKCGKLFSDSEGKNETTFDDLKIAKTGIHKGGTADCMHKAKCVVWSVRIFRVFLGAGNFIHRRPYPGAKTHRA